MKIGIVVSETYWVDITGKMLSAAQETAQQAGAQVEVIKVPGSFDIPLQVKKLLQRKEIDGVVTLGAVIKGDTDHDQVICHAVAKSLIDLSLEFEKPVVLGINGPEMSRAQARARISRAAEVMKACLDLVGPAQ